MRIGGFDALERLHRLQQQLHRLQQKKTQTPSQIQPKNNPDPNPQVEHSHAPSKLEGLSKVGQKIDVVG